MLLLTSGNNTGIIWLVIKSIPNDMDRLIAMCEQHICETVSVKAYDFAPCYLWHDRPLYNEFGEQIDLLKGNTIYLHKESTTPINDLFHELGHVTGRKFNTVGNRENGYHGSWEDANARLIAQVSQQTHWSAYLNLFSINQNEFKVNAASELWAELFMLWHLQPNMPESKLIGPTMTSIEHTDDCIAIAALADELCVLR